MRVLKMTRNSILKRLKYAIKQINYDESLPLHILRRRIKRRRKQETLESYFFSHSMDSMSMIIVEDE
jgi:hypothetical protein